VPSAQPTQKASVFPSSCPTVYPTIKAGSEIEVDFDVQQVVGGMSLDDFNDDLDANEKGFKEAVVEGMGFGTIDNVINLEVKENTRRRLLKDMPFSYKLSDLKHRNLQNNELLFSYTISAIVGEGNSFNSPSHLYNSAVQSLDQNIIDGNFEDNLRNTGLSAFR